MAIEDFNSVRVVELSKLMDPNAWDEGALRLLQSTGALDTYRRRDRSYALALEAWRQLDNLMAACGVHVTEMTEEARIKRLTIS